MSKRSFLAAVVLFCTAAVAVPARAGFSPAGTVTFANLQTAADAVASVAGKSPDPVLKMAVPRAIRNQAAARLFGSMRPGMPGVAVCYVDAQAAARLMASKNPTEAEFDRTKRWTVLYPASIRRDVFLQKHPEAKMDQTGVIAIPPGPHSRRTFYAWYSPDGNWVTLAPSASMALHTYKAALGALARPLGPDLAFIKVDATGAFAMFHSKSFGGGEVSVRMTPAGLELRGAVRTALKVLPPLPPMALAFAGVPANAPLFGMTSLPDDLRSTEVFSLLGPSLGEYIRKSSVFKLAPGANAYWLPGDATTPAANLKARLFKILPEAAKPGAANVMFCSPTTVLRINLPLYAKKCMPAESVQMHAALRMLRKVRGDGLGFMGWREKGTDRFLVRISRDELWGTANLWSLMFL